MKIVNLQLTPYIQITYVPVFRTIAEYVNYRVEIHIKHKNTNFFENFFFYNFIFLTKKQFQR